MCEPLYVKSYILWCEFLCLLSSVVTITLSTGLIAGIGVVCVVVILLTFLAGCGVGVIVLVVYQKKSKQSTSMLYTCVCTSHTYFISILSITNLHGMQERLYITTAPYRIDCIYIIHVHSVYACMYVHVLDS